MEIEFQIRKLADPDHPNTVELDLDGRPTDRNCGWLHGPSAVEKWRLPAWMTAPSCSTVRLMKRWWKSVLKRRMLLVNCSLATARSWKIPPALLRAALCG